MAPARTEEDPVTAEYDVYLTPALEEQLYLLQYPNKERERPYNIRHNQRPDRFRIKPKSGYLEMDIDLHTEHNFNRYRGLSFGDSVNVAKQAQNGSTTYGLASGFSSSRVRGGSRRQAVKDEADRALDLSNDLTTFYDAYTEDKVMHTQTLGGQILLPKHDTPSESAASSPHYFVGAFKGSSLHLTAISATVQMRPQFHHVDAEDQRKKFVAARDHATATAADVKPEIGEARVVQQTYRSSTNPKGELEQREHEMKVALQSAAEEAWIPLEYVDEDAMEAFELWNERMFVEDTGVTARLESSMTDEEFLDEMSAPRSGSLARRRKRAVRKKQGEEDVMDLDDKPEPEMEQEQDGQG